LRPHPEDATGHRTRVTGACVSPEQVSVSTKVSYCFLPMRRGLSRMLAGRHCAGQLRQVH